MMFFKKKKPEWTFLIKKEDIANDLRILNVRPGDDIVRHMAHDLIGLTMSDAIGGETSKKYKKIFLENYEKTKAIQLLKKYSEVSVVPKGKSIIRDIFRDLLRIEGPIIASWVVANPKESGKVVKGIEKMLKKTEDEELNSVYADINKIVEVYKKIIEEVKSKQKSKKPTTQIKKKQ